MSTLPLAALLLLIHAAAPASAQDHPAPDPADVASVGAVIEALYASISGPPGQPRDWARFEALFHPGARLMPTGCRADASCVARVWTPAEYRAAADSSLVALGFRETELARREGRFGTVAHAFSAYASFRGDETVPFMRGVNSVQLFWDGARWWILSVFWDTERPGNPLPADLGG